MAQIISERSQTFQPLILEEVNSKHGQHRENYFRDYYLDHKEKLKEYSRECYEVKKLIKGLDERHETSHTHIIYPKKKKGLKEKKATRNPPDTKLFNTNLGGRPRSQEAQELGRPLNNQERQKRKRFKKKLNQFYQENQKPVIKLIDNPNIRVKTKGKVPQRKDWPNWYEWLTADHLKRQYNEVGARTGKRVYYRGSNQYFLYILDEDHNKKNKNLPEALRQKLEAQGIERTKRLGIGSNKTTNGRHTIILSRTKLPPIALTYGVYKPADWLGEGQQAIINGPGKEWQGTKRIMIIKDFSDLKKKLAKWGYTAIDKTQPKQRINYNDNIKVYKQEKTKRIIRQRVKERPAGETFIISEPIINIRELEAMGIMNQPHEITTPNRKFYADYYYKNQEKIKDYEGLTAQIELKQGNYYQFLNKIICQAH